MATNILMPALSPTMEEGKLARWLVKEGDSVSSGDLLAEIETDKATMEFEAVDEGTIGQILVAEGTDNVKVGTVIAMIAEEGESADSVEAPTSGGAPAEQAVYALKDADVILVLEDVVPFTPGRTSPGPDTKIAWVSIDPVLSRFKTMEFRADLWIPASVGSTCRAMGRAMSQTSRFTMVQTTMRAPPGNFKGFLVLMGEY